MVWDDVHSLTIPSLFLSLLQPCLCNTGNKCGKQWCAPFLGNCVNEPIKNKVKPSYSSLTPNGVDRCFVWFLWHAFCAVFNPGSTLTKLAIKKDGHHFYTHINQVVIDPPPQPNDKKTHDKKEDCKGNDAGHNTGIKHPESREITGGYMKTCFVILGLFLSILAKLFSG